MTDDELAELMAEPPGGPNFGRSRGEQGGWKYLDDEMSSVLDAELPQYDNPSWSAGTRATKPPDTIPHGRISSYVNDGCRCKDCRAAWALYKRSYRGLS